MNDLAAIDTSTARLPSTYQAAKAAISQCARLDECKDWADKASALASYAKQAQDTQLEDMAKRIRARATRRAGQLLQQIEPSKGGRPAKTNEGAHTSFSSRRDVAAEAGLSEHQKVQAQRLATLPEAQFEEMCEQGETVTKMAEAGTQRRNVDRKAAKALMAAVRAYSSKVAALDLSEALAGLDEAQRAEMRSMITRLDGVHDRIVTGI